MDTRLLGYEHAATVTEIAAWANDLIGHTVPDLPTYQVVRVIHFQVIDTRDGYDAMILVEVTQQEGDTRLVLKEEDAAIIEQITSTVDESS